jgi:hypothetical protein
VPRTWLQNMTNMSLFWDNVSVGHPGGCWVWEGPIQIGGYGSWTGYKPKRTRVAHRWSYEALAGPVPEGLDLDHLCHDAGVCPGGTTCPHRRCVNPQHLRPATRKENMARGHWATKTHCPKGHPYVEENTYRSKTGARTCRICHSAWMARWYQTNHAAIRQRRAVLRRRSRRGTN